MAVRARPKKSRQVDPTPGRVGSSNRKTNALKAYFAFDYIICADCLMATLVRTRRTASSCSYNPGFYRALNNGDNISADLTQASASQSLALSWVVPNYLCHICWAGVLLVLLNQHSKCYLVSYPARICTREKRSGAPSSNT